MKTTPARRSRVFCAALYRGALALAASCFLLGGCKAPQNAAEPPVFQREMRAAWVTTFDNVDWPSKPGMSTERQLQEMDAIIERAKELRLNALLVQVRDAANATFYSEHEPWAGSLMGKRGTPPNPKYDPLEEWVKRGHAAGLEVHAWMIPFLAYNDPPGTYKGKHTPRIVMHGRHAYFDPGDGETQQYLLEVYADVVQRYDIEGVAFEHYFYPPPTTQPATQAAMTAPTEPPPVRNAPYQSYFFNDDVTYEAYRKNGGGQERDEWRRENVNHFITSLREMIHTTKPWVRLGISPFGIPSPDTPDFVKGERYHDAYKQTYADAERWLREGWVDYLIPELYWKTGSPQEPFLGLLKWWVDPKHNPEGRNVYAGLNTSAVATRDWSPDEIAGQVMIARQTDGAGGAAHFSMRTLTQDSKGIADLLRCGVYEDGALPPASPWLGKKPPEAPTGLKASVLTASELQASMAATPRVIVPPLASTRPSAKPFTTLTQPSRATAEKEKTLGGFRITWDAPASDAVWRWAVYSRHGDRWTLQVVGRGESKAGEAVDVIVPDDIRLGPADAIAVSAVDRLGNESPRAKYQLKK